MWMARSSETVTIFDPDELYRAHQTYMSDTHPQLFTITLVLTVHHTAYTNRGEQKLTRKLLVS